MIIFTVDSFEKSSSWKVAQFAGLFDETVTVLIHLQKWLASLPRGIKRKFSYVSWLIDFREPEAGLHDMEGARNGHLINFVNTTEACFR